MQLTDTHTHLHFDQYENDRDEVIRRAEEQGVVRMLTLGTDLPTSLKSVKLADRHEIIFAAAGIHPTDILPSSAEDIIAIKKLVPRTPKLVAIGEIGLDLYWKEVPLEAQIPVLEQMLDMARQADLPVVIHNREAHIPMRRYFEKWSITQLRGVMHSFSGTVEDARFFLERGLFISFTGVITFRNFRDREVIESVPLDRLLLETDSPFLTPVPWRGKRNEPSFVKYVAEKLAEIHRISLDEICRITSENARKLFRW